jgi:CHAD domain-containing protein
MAFTLDRTTPIPEAVRTAAGAELRQIVMALTGQAELGPDEAAHDARKRTKKLRALLRLVRRELGEEVYREENRALRDAARQLSAVRDAWVLVETLDHIVTPPDDEISPEAVAALRAVLAAEHRALQGGEAGGDAPARAALEFERALVRVERWPLRDNGWHAVETGLAESARRGRKAMLAARAKGRPEDFHEWRKQVKYLRHQFALLRDAWPEVLDAMESTADEAGELLGTDHDLAVLRERIEAEAVLDDATRAALVHRIEARRADLPGRAIALGRRLYSEKPASLAHRLGKLWKRAA